MSILVIALSINSFPASLWTPIYYSVSLLKTKRTPAVVPTNITSSLDAIHVSTSLERVPNFIYLSKTGSDITD